MLLTDIPSISLLLAPVLFIIAFLSAYSIRLVFKINYDSTRNESIDGLRGFLGVGVFVHHVAIWRYFLLSGGSWDAPKSHVYNHLGQTSVTFFFMISAYLFVSRILNSKTEFNWPNFFLSRLYRLGPMYYVSVILVLIYVFILTNFSLPVPFSEFAVHLLNASTFNIYTYFCLMDCQVANHVNAGVLWTLPFEWLFYLSLPLISFLLLRTGNKLFVVLSIAFIASFYYFNTFQVFHLLSFAGGVAAALLHKYSSISKIANSHISGIVILVCTGCLAFYPGADDVVPKLLTSIAFILIASGNTLWGFLKNSTLKFMGEITYSIYLLHGILLFLLLYTLLGTEKAQKMSDMNYSVYIALLTPVLVLVSYFCYRFVEKPFIDLAKKRKY